MVAGDHGGGGGGEKRSAVRCHSGTDAELSFHLLLPHHTMVIAKHVSYLIWIVWYPAGPDPIWSPGGGGGALLSWRRPRRLGLLLGGGGQ